MSDEQEIGAADVADAAELGVSDNLVASSDDVVEVDVVPVEEEAEADSADALDVGDVADLLAGALESGNSQAAAAAFAEYDKLGRTPVQGGPLKIAAVEEAEEEEEA